MTSKKTQQAKSRTSGIRVDDEDQLIRAVGRSTMEEVAEIVRLKGRGHTARMIMSELGISKSTYHRRMKLLRRQTSPSPEKAKKAAMQEIGKTVAFYREMRAAALEMSGLLDDLTGPGRENTVPLEIRAKGIKLALRAQDDLMRFLLTVGYFDTYRAQQKMKADSDLFDHVNRDLQGRYLELLDQNHELRENLLAIRRGEPEPFPEAIEGTVLDLSVFKSDEKHDTSDADTDFSDFRLLH
ncbi:MAG: hypothetical protein KDJ90_09530 [Nitratireductor sp.]|nr:hypothetical protein [Nitratireductor sp.]